MNRMKVASLPSYPAYKPSGIPWLGELPDHWEPMKIQHLAESATNSFTDGDWIESPYITTEGIRLIQTGNIGVGSFVEKGFRYISDVTFDELNCTEVNPGDILICRLGEPVARACAAPDLESRMITSVDVCIVKTRDNLNQKFAIYAMSSHPYLTWVNSLVRGSTRDRISRSMLGKFAIPFPPPDEQASIVRFLDHADEQIQRYIAGKERLIALLEEERQALVHQAVTRGLDPGVPLKSSGVEWLGDVPEHWDVVRLGSMGRFSKGNGGTKEDEVPAGIPCVRYGDIYTSHKYFIRASRAHIETEKTSDYTPLRFGDLLFAGSGETIEEIGKSAVNLIEGPAYSGGDVIIFRPTVRLNPEFTGYAADSPASQAQKSIMGRGFTVMHIYGNQLKNLQIALPPIHEQDRIVEHINRGTARIDQETTSCYRQIDLMNEYRTRLIADVVTGQMDVRYA